MKNKKIIAVVMSLVITAGSISFPALCSAAEEEITYTIENASPAVIEADVDVVLDYDNTTWFTASVDKDSISLDQNGTATVAVTVTLEDTPATDAEVP